MIPVFQKLLGSILLLLAACPFAVASDLWSLKPVGEFTPPLVEGYSHPVDRFLAAKRLELGLTPPQPASKQVLIRRATFDLTGLPPTPEEVEQFLADSSSDAFERLVDRLLARPQYGEKWGRHWLDLVRYADTSGCNSDFPIPSAFRYRNYVIDSFNQDKPYNVFIKEQIAGDLLEHFSLEQRNEHIIATGYLANARRFGSRAAEFHQSIEDIIDNMGKAFMGLSLGCARCHDHKFDPVSAADYYALYGIFDSTRFAFPGTEVYRHTKDFTGLGSDEEAKKLMEWQSELGQLDDDIEKKVQEISHLKSEREKAAQAAREGAEPAKPAKTVEEAEAEMAKLKERLATLEKNPPPVEKAYAVFEGTPKNARIHKKGEPHSLGDEVPRRFLTVLGGQTLPEDCNQSGRLQLAKWISDPKNPLTARVIVNRIWQHHFGEGIVSTPNDFGTRGKPPTHPELLDYLAQKFLNDGWSIKRMHKFIMLSQAYQASSAEHQANSKIDFANAYLWRFNQRRLSAEEIRDSLMHISGELDLSMGGEHPFPPEHEWRYTQHKQFVADYPSPKRSIYLLQQRIRKNPLLESFDAADANATMGERPVTTTPLQALFMLNSPFVHEHAGKLARRVSAARESERDQIDLAYRLAFGRPAGETEIADGIEYLSHAREHVRQQEPEAKDARPEAMASLMRVLVSGNEFIYID